MPALPSLFTLEGEARKFDTADSILPYITPLAHPDAPSTITEVRFQGNTIGVDAARCLAPHLSSLSSLKIANLADIFTGRLLSEIPQALEALLSALLQCEKLERIDLSDNAFGLNTQAPLVKFLERATPLRQLILNNNGLGPEAGKLISGALTKLAEAKRLVSSSKGEQPVFLDTIVCGRNRLENGSMEGWAEAIKAHGEGLRSVKMVQNGIRQEGIQVLLRQGFKHARGLKVLDLQDNTFTKVGAMALAEVVTGWSELTELGVGDSLLSSRGGVLLGEALAKSQNKNLAVLRLQYNEIDARGVESLANAMEAGALPNLRRVELNGNKFAEEDPAVDKLKERLEDVKEKTQDKTMEDVEWGLDDLSDLEEDSDGEDEDESDAGDDLSEDGEEGVSLSEKGEDELKKADEAENENVSQKKDPSVDALAEKLGQTTI